MIWRLIARAFIPFWPLAPLSIARKQAFKLIKAKLYLFKRGLISPFAQRI